MSEGASISEPPRLRATMRALHLSPLMAIALATLATLAALSSVFAAGVLLRGGDTSGGDHNVWRPPQPAAFESSKPAPASLDAQTLSRPLFAKTRRPSLERRATEDPHKEVTGPATGLLVGAIILYGKNQRAYVTGAKAADGNWYAVGEKVEGWTVAEIRKTDLTLKSATGDAVLRLYPDPSSEPPPEAPKQAAAAAPLPAAQRGGIAPAVSEFRNARMR